MSLEDGCITSDQPREISGITYNISNLPEQIVKGSSNIKYWYDNNGNRYRKQEGVLDEIYVLGINGETEAVFDINGTIKFFNILSGSEIIGRFAPTPVDLYLSNTTNPSYYASYTYKPSGQIEIETLNNGQRQVQTSYDVKNRPTLISSPLFTETLTYETGGYGGVGYYHCNIASASFNYNSGGPAAYQTLYQYDNLGRLKIADNNITALNPYDISNINYDLNGNITSITKGVTTYNYNYYGGTNRLQNAAGV